MELHITRGEILRQVRSLLGMQTDGSLDAQVAEQHVVIVNAAAVKAQQECGWVNIQGRTTVDLGAEQNVLNYPENAGPGSVRGMAVYEGERYYVVEPRIIPVHADQDQQQAAGGESFDAVKGRPRYFEQRNQLALWPYSDKAYKIRIDYIRPVQMPLDSSVSIVDAQLIIFLSVAMLATQMADDRSAKLYGDLYLDRRNALMAWQSQGTRFAMSSEADMGEDEMFTDSMLPSWDRRLTIAPGA